MDKKEIFEVIEDSIAYELEGNIRDAIYFLSSIESKYKDKYIRIELDYNSLDYDDLPSMRIYGIRLETDEEYEKRIKG